MDTIPNVLAERYASEELKAIWSPKARILFERTFWIAVMRAQRDLGVEIPQEAIEAYEAVKEKIDLESIDKRERVTKHDVKARIDEFCTLAGQEHIHKGMTSRDLTENVEQLQVYVSLMLMRKKVVASLIALGKRIEETKGIPMTARTHNCAAQITTLGKRLAMYAEEILKGLDRLNYLIENFAFRGLKGAVGTQMDPIALFEGDKEKAGALDKKILEYLGAPHALNAVGQVYPRSLDFEVVSVLFQLGAGPSSFATTLRLMSGFELMTEGFSKGQVGSSAMPHKMNPRSCERINGFKTILSGYVTMAMGLSGDQWNEGDVSCSVVRRVVLPDSFYAIDGIYNTFLTVVGQMTPVVGMIERENQHYLPFLLTTQALMESVKEGVGRETAHERIKEHAIKTVNELREGKIQRNDFFDRLEGDVELKLSSEKLEEIYKMGLKNRGAADKQVDVTLERIGTWAKKVPEASGYKVGAIL